MALGSPSPPQLKAPVLLAGCFAKATPALRSRVVPSGCPHSQAPGDPPPWAALPLPAEVKGSDPDLPLPVPTSQRSRRRGPLPAPPAHATPRCWDNGRGDFSGFFRGLVLTPHRSKGVLDIQARVTLPSAEAAHSPQLWGFREGGCWGCLRSPFQPVLTSSKPQLLPQFRRDGGLVPKGMGGTSLMLA